MPQSDSHITPQRRLMAASFGSLLMSFFDVPFDVVKIRLQIQRIQIEQDLQFKNSFDCAYKIIRYEGIKSFYAGLNVKLLMQIPMIVIYFTSYDTIRNFIYDNYTSKPRYKKYKKTHHFLVPAICGGLSRGVAGTFIHPLELVCVQYQSKTVKNNVSIINSLRLNFRSEGFKGLYKGLVATLFRDVVFAFVYWPCLEFMKDFLKARYAEKYGTTAGGAFMIPFASGAASAALGVLVVTPFDVIKTRRQSNLENAGEANKAFGNKELKLRGQDKKTMISITKDIIKNEGWRGMYVGLGMRLTRIPMSVAILMGTYDFCKSYWDRQEYKVRNLDD